MKPDSGNISPVSEMNDRPCSFVDEMAEPVLFGGSNPHCVVCGTENSHGLRIQFQRSETGVIADWSPGEKWASFRGVIHGGIVATVLDEAMSKAIMAAGWRALTAELRVRFHNVVRPGQTFTAEAWVVEKRRTKISAEAKLTSVGGIEHAHAYASFLEIPG